MFHLSFMPSWHSVTKLSFHFSLRTEKSWDNKIVLNQFLAFDLLKWMSKTELRVKLCRDMEYCPLHLNGWKIGAAMGWAIFFSMCRLYLEKILPALHSWRFALCNFFFFFLITWENKTLLIVWDYWWRCLFLLFNLPSSSGFAFRYRALTLSFLSSLFQFYLRLVPAP